MPELVYIFCGLTSIACVALLFRQYQTTRTPLLFWSVGCFVLFAVSNILLFVDLIMLPHVDLSSVRYSLTLIGMCMMLYGLVRQNT
jgi:Family of unknown function (DUF5985)